MLSSRRIASRIALQLFVLASLVRNGHCRCLFDKMVLRMRQLTSTALIVWSPQVLVA